MNLKYIEKNDGYIIDRKFANPNEIDTLNTYTTKGKMILSEIIPVDNTEVEKTVIEYAFDSMKDNVLKTIKRKYFVSDKGIINFYFEGNVEKDDNNKIYVDFKDNKVAVIPANLNLNFEVEVKVTPINFLKIQYDNLIYKINSIY